MKVWAISDIVDVHKSELLMAWNSLVSKDDEVFILGNFANSISDIQYMIENFNGKFGFFIANNKDKIILEYSKMNPSLLGTKYLVFQIPFVNMNNGALLSYYPFAEWDGKIDGKLQYHGKETNVEIGQSICVSWDINYELVEINKSYVEK